MHLLYLHMVEYYESIYTILSYVDMIMDNFIQVYFYMIQDIYSLHWNTIHKSIGAA